MEMLTRFSVVALITLLLTGCKLEITVPEGGDVVSDSGAYECAGETTCVVEVNEFTFDETFRARAWDGWVFIGWKVGPDHFCKDGPCHLFTVGFENNESLAAIVESDKTYYLEPVFIEGTPYPKAYSILQDQNLRDCIHAIEPHIQYAEEIKRLDCNTYRRSRIESLHGIENFSGIKHLRLSTSESLTNLEPLGSLTRLERLEYYSGSPYFNAAALGELKLLHHLKLHMNWRPLRSTADVTELYYLQNLRTLELIDVSSDLDPISSMVNLRKLVIEPINHGSIISNLRPLENLKRLRVLRIVYSGSGTKGYVDDVSALAELPDLKILDLSHNRITQIGPLRGLEKLESLNLSDNQISDIWPLANLMELKNLDLSVNQISSINSLASLANIEMLDLSHNEISDIEPLNTMNNIKTLDLSTNQISHIDSLVGIESIPALDLANNLISEVSALGEIYPVGLEHDFSVEIDLSDNPITSIGKALDGIQTGLVLLVNLPISCEEYARLAGEYESRMVVAYDPVAGIFNLRDILTNPDDYYFVAEFRGYFHPKDCW